MDSAFSLMDKIDKRDDNEIFIFQIKTAILYFYQYNERFVLVDELMNEIRRYFKLTNYEVPYTNSNLVTQSSTLVQRVHKTSVHQMTALVNTLHYLYLNILSIYYYKSIFFYRYCFTTDMSMIGNQT